MKLSAEKLRELVVYEPDTGKFFRRIDTGRGGRHKAGAELKAKQPHGYIRFSVNSQENYAHRLAWLYMTGEWPKQHIDHINGDRADNRWCNLRDVPQRVNRENRVVASCRSKTGILGVSYDEKRDMFRVCIQAGDKRFSKRYKTIDEASYAYIQAKLRLHEGFPAERAVIAATRWTA